MTWQMIFAMAIVAAGLVSSIVAWLRVGRLCRRMELMIYATQTAGEYAEKAGDYAKAAGDGAKVRRYSVIPRGRSDED